VFAGAEWFVVALSGSLVRLMADSGEVTVGGDGLPGRRAPQVSSPQPRQIDRELTTRWEEPTRAGLSSSPRGRMRRSATPGQGTAEVVK
jgi:hypothetical protein